MKSPKNSDSHEKISASASSSRIQFSPRGDAFKHPVQHFDVAKVHTVSEALEAFNTTSFQSRMLGKCCKIWLHMLSDPDPTLRGMRIDRVYDTYADDVMFTKADEFVEKFSESLEPRGYSSREFFQLMGQRINDEYGILATAAREHLPIFCPALADSSIGMALTVYRNEQLDQGRPPMVYDPMLDNLEIMSLKRRWQKSGVIFIGGGTPKNYIQQVVPMAEIAGMPVPPHSYAIQVTTDDAKFGGLSGCELPESQSWGKLDPKAEQCTVHVDATIGLPLLFTGVMEHYEEWKGRGRLNHNWGESLQAPAVRKARKVSA